MRKFGFLLLFGVFASCGPREMELWYYFGEIHDYHFKNLLSGLWKEIPFSVVPRKMPSIRALEDSLIHSNDPPDMALTYPSTIKELFRAGRLERVDFENAKNVLPGYCEFDGEKYCWPLFKSFMGFFINLPLARELGLDTNFSITDLVRMETEYVIAGIYVSATVYTAFTFTFISEGKGVQEACVEAGKLYYTLIRTPHVRIYRSPIDAQEDFVLGRLLLYIGTSAHTPYIEREGINMKFLPLKNEKKESVFFLSGPDLVILKGGNKGYARTFISALQEKIREDTVWRRLGYELAEDLKGRHIYHDMNLYVPRAEIREMLRGFLRGDTLNPEELKNLCAKFREM